MFEIRIQHLTFTSVEASIKFSCGWISVSKHGTGTRWKQFSKGRMSVLQEQENESMNVQGVS